MADVLAEICAAKRAHVARRKLARPEAELRALLDGAGGALREVVLLNSAAALVVAGRAEDLRDGIASAARALDSGAARDVLDRLVRMTNEGTAGG